MAAARLAGMLIGVDARADVGTAGGRGRVVGELIEQFVALADGGSNMAFRFYVSGTGSGCARDPRISTAAIGGPELIWHARAARDANRTVDVFLSTNSYLTPYFLSVPCVVMVYDLIPFIKAARPRLRSRLIENLTLGGAVRRAATIVAISQATADDLAAHYPVAAKKTVVAPLAASRNFSHVEPEEEAVAIRHKYDIGDRFILVVGTVEPRKNLVRLIRAYSRLSSTLRRACQLVVVGGTGWRAKEIDASISAMPDGVRSLGYVPDSDLPALYRQCELFCYPSLYEGFGLPVLEAMQCGAPVVTSNLSALPEVGGQAVRCVDPYDVDEIRTGIEAVLSDTGVRQRMSRQGVERAREFTWERTARIVVAACERAAAGGRTGVGDLAAACKRSGVSSRS